MSHWNVLVGKGITKEAFANSRPRTNQTELNQPPSGDGPESRRMQGSGRSMPRTRATLTALTPDVRKDSTPRAGPGPDLLCQRRNKPAESQLVRCLGLGIVRLRGHSRPPGHHEMQFRPRVTETHLLQVTAPDRAGRQSLWLLPRSVHASQCLQGTPVDLQTPPGLLGICRVIDNTALISPRHPLKYEGMLPSEVTTAPDQHDPAKMSVVSVGITIACRLSR
jgi:hypothetical protein